MLTPRHGAQTFPDNPALPAGDSPQFQRANALLKLERELFGAWCELTFRPGMGPFGARAVSSFSECMDRVDQALGETDGPWFLGGEVRFEWTLNLKGNGHTVISSHRIPHSVSSLIPSYLTSSRLASAGPPSV